ncbi:hypothetical protein L1887_57917 [Cichorium endivia]|nr:hypothetical protein L1887_57917 [Cichorium endivia]
MSGRRIGSDNLFAPHGLVRTTQTRPSLRKEERQYIRNSSAHTHRISSRLAQSVERQTLIQGFPSFVRCDPFVFSISLAPGSDGLPQHPYRGLATLHSCQCTAGLLWLAHTVRVRRRRALCGGVQTMCCAISNGYRAASKGFDRRNEGWESADLSESGKVDAYAADGKLCRLLEGLEHRILVIVIAVASLALCVAGGVGSARVGIGDLERDADGRAPWVGGCGRCIPRPAISVSSIRAASCARSSGSPGSWVLLTRFGRVDRACGRGGQERDGESGRLARVFATVDVGKQIQVGDVAAQHAARSIDEFDSPSAGSPASRSQCLGSS